MSTTDGAAYALKYIEAAIGLATHLTAERLAATTENIEAYFRLEEYEPTTEFNADEVQPFIATLVIEPDLLNDLTSIIHTAKEAYKACLQNASLPNEQRGCDREFERSILELLEHIKIRNQDQLPTSILNKLWNRLAP